MKNSNVLIVGGIVIGIIIILIAILYNNQEPEIIEPEIIEPTDFEFNFNDSKTKEVLGIDKKLDGIEKKASEYDFTPAPREWITSGPFQIDRSQYHLGEKIFLRIGGLDVNEKGQIAFLRPLNETHYSVYQTIPFDGTQKNAFNYYLDVRLSKALQICTIEDITRGEWAVVFRGTDYPTIKFKFIEEFIPGEEDAFEESPC